MPDSLDITHSSMTFTASQFFCENNFEGGGWALVRRVRQGTTWHPATDNLQGTDTYGTSGNSSSNSTFSLHFASLITSSETLFLLANGMGALKDDWFMHGWVPVCSWMLEVRCHYFLYIRMHVRYLVHDYSARVFWVGIGLFDSADMSYTVKVICKKSSVFIPVVVAGDMSNWLIAPYSSINNGGQAYSSLPRPVLKSSASSSPCIAVVAIIMFYFLLVLWYSCCYYDEILFHS